MAKVNHCEYCKKTVINQPYHPECRRWFLENLCAQVQGMLCSKRVLPTLPHDLRELAEMFRNGHFTTEQNSRRAEEEAEELERRQKLWELARDEHLQKAQQKWERENPEPNPPRC